MNFSPTPYWRIVCDCLVEFHHFGEQEAQQRIREFRLQLAGTRGEVDASLVYHQEPLHLAAQLAGHEVREPEPQQARRYAELLQKRTAEAAALGTDEEVLGRTKRQRAA